MTKMLIITNNEGRIVGAAYPATPSSTGINTGIRPLPGQRIYEADVPDEIARLPSGHLLHQAFMGASFDAPTGKLTFKALK
jgi:hypothetical protein